MLESGEVTSVARPGGPARAARFEAGFGESSRAICAPCRADRDGKSWQFGLIMGGQTSQSHARAGREGGSSRPGWVNFGPDPHFKLF